MNQYIEFFQWAVGELKSFWASHGTKMLGAIFTAFNSVVAYLALLSASPQSDLLVTPRQFAILAVINAALGGAMYRRGYSNDQRAVT